ncbi:DUF1127 domain-containing protein [Yoonia sp. SS1-5]|uniref:DUF1127 domain-containing protein n=1 Tax=Yoonia rhodophyticola TaxID=3137370 RepID=A0AAN0MA04_9RHOB
MAAFDTTRPATGIFAGGIFHFVARILSAVSDWNDERITRNALSKLTARELDDIGLSVHSINATAKRRVN